MKRLPSILLFSTLALALAVPANAATPSTIPRTRPAAPRPARDGQRFLFVVNISSAMRGTEAANRQALFDLIFTGLEGQMRTGDSFGLWLFNDELRAKDFPMQVWEEQKPLDTASLATKFLREQKYSGKSRPEVMMPRLLNLIKSVRDVNVLILSDGEPALAGTPFDANIAAAYERRQSERSKAQKPFVTALVARGGAIVSGAVVLAGEYVKFPERVVPALAAKGTNSGASPTNAARPVAAAARVTSANPPPLQEAGEPQTTVSLTPEPAVAPKPKVIQIITRPTTAPKNPAVAEPVPTNTQAAVTPPLAPPPAPPVPAPPRSAATTLPETFLAAPVPVAARELSPPIPADARPVSQPPPAVDAVVTPPSRSSGALLFTIGGLLLAGCLGLLAMVLRRPKTAVQVSIITRSMDRH